MGKKYIIIIMQVLTSICMLSVGFASWTIVSGASLTAEGEIKAENVESNDRYIQMISCDNFRYYDTGFLRTEETQNGDKYQVIVTETSMTYNYQLDLYNLKEDMEGQSDLNILFTFSHPTIKVGNSEDTYTIIADYFAGYEIETSYNYTIIGESDNTSSNSYFLNISFKDLVNNYEGDGTDESTRYVDFKIKINFDLTANPEYNDYIDEGGKSEIYFKENVYNCFIDSNFGFIMKVDVEYVE